MAPSDELLPAAPHLAEALRVLAEVARELTERGDPLEAESLGGAASALRAGTSEGRLWVGPKDEAVAVGLWEPPGEIGRDVRIVFARGFRGAAAIARLVRRLDGDGGPPIARFRLPGIPSEPGGLAEALAAQGFSPRERVDLVYPESAALPSVREVNGIRSLAVADEKAIARLLERAYADLPEERALFAVRRDPAEDARVAARKLIDGTYGDWWADASFGIDGPGGLAAATLVNDLHGPLLTEVMTDPAARGRGYASALIATSLAAVRRRRPPIPPRLVVSWENRPARRLYLALGFSPVEATRGRVWVRSGPAPAPSPSGRGGVPAGPPPTRQRAEGK